MKIKKVTLKKFKRFTNLTIDLGDKPKKIIALVGENGCGKSSIFDAFEEKIKIFVAAEALMNTSLNQTIHQVMKKNMNALIQFQLKLTNPRLLAK